MPSDPPSRREWLAAVVSATPLATATTTTAAAHAAAHAAPAAPSQTAAPPADPEPTRSRPGFGFCLNTSTVRDKDGKSRPIRELVDLAARAGYDAIEPWASEIAEYLQTGGTLKELRKRIEGAGLKVADLIGFAEWLVEDPTRRRKGLETAKRDMGWAAELGCPRIAAPPVGATGGRSPRDDPKHTAPVTDLLVAAERYHDLFEVGRAAGVTPLVEIWGFSRTLRRLGEALCVAAESGVAGAAVLPDIYHLYKGGSGFSSLGLLSATAIGIFHVNDYPMIDPDTITDADRVYPGDGVAPLRDVFAALRAMNYRGFVSLELFNRGYWKQDPLEVAKTGLAKLKAAAGL